MSEPNLSPTPIEDNPSSFKSTYSCADWLASATFGSAFQRSIYLLKHEFRWLVFLFFIGGVIMSMILIPVNEIIGTIEILITIELFAPVPDFLLLYDLIIASLMWGLLQKFVVFFGSFILGTAAVYHVMKAIPSLHVLVSNEETVGIPIGSTLAAAVITASLLSIASVIPFAVPLLQVLFFFLPILLVLGQFSLSQSFSLSIRFRVQHWGRILSTLILGYLLILFAGLLGQTFYWNIETLLGVYGLSLGIFSPILLSLLNQLPIAMVAPLLPLFSIAFFSGARGAYRAKQHERFMQLHSSL
ncbi:MAG: hypothetical protein ACFFBR_00040 [Promethearchaeota archaeon]